MAKSLRDQILDASDMQSEPVVVPEWGGITVWVKTMTAGERDAFEADILQKQGKGRNASYEPNTHDYRAKLLVRCLVDEQGNRIFGPGDVKAVSQKSVAAIQRLYNVAIRVNAITPEDEEDLLGNSETGPSGDSSSD